VDKITNVRIIKADMVDHKSLSIAASEVSKITNKSLDHLIVNGAYLDLRAYFITPTEFIGQEDLLRREFSNNLDVNVLGVMYSINAFLPLIRKGNAKKITVISTGLAELELAQKINIAFAVLYSSTKAAANIIVAKYAAELSGEGIILLALSPGVVNTATGPRKFTRLDIHDRNGDDSLEADDPNSTSRIYTTNARDGSRILKILSGLQGAGHSSRERASPEKCY
jgi:NAD(P)-dependent dehydrogenase (short-subunit alcohol dehydrogenase family)